MKRILAVLLAALMLMSMAVVASAEEAISWWSYDLGDYVEDNYIESYVQDKLGIEITSPKVAHTDSEAVNLMISQEMPDCMFSDKSWAYMQDQELTRSIPVDMLREYAPEYAAFMDKYPAMWAKCLDPEDPTQLRFLTDCSITYTDMYIYCIYLRYDWIQKLGIDLGVEVDNVYDRLYIAEKGLSLEVFNEILTKFVNEDPDGNGVNDTYGYIKDYKQFLSAFGLTNYMNEFEGKATPWYVHPACKEMLAYLQGAYAEGLIYDEIFTIGWGQDWEIVNQQKAGVWASSTNALNSWANNRPPLTLLDQVPEATLLVIPGIADADGHTHRGTELTPTGGENFYIRWDVSDEKLADILRLYNFVGYACTEQDSAIMCWGKEGVAWEWNEDKTMPYTLEGYQPGVDGAGVFNRTAEHGALWRWISYEPMFEAAEKYFIAGFEESWCNDLVYDYKTDYFGATQASAISNEYSADWSAIRDAYFLDVITGVKNVEEDWDAYIAALNEVEFQAYLDELDKAPTAQEILDMYA